MDEFMKEAILEAFEGIGLRTGGPFGAVIVKDNKIIARGHNKVIETNDPTAHAEIVAIREATKLLGRFDLSDCILYTTCEPCPMCYSAAHWAKIPLIYYGATQDDAKDIGFDDSYIYEVLQNKHSNEKMKICQIDRELCLEPFRKYEEDEERILY